MVAIYRGELPRRFVGISGCNSRYDPLMAPPGKHSAFWWPMAPYSVGSDGAGFWDANKDAIAARLLDEWAAYAPNVAGSNVLGSYVFSPLDIERTCINMVRGSHHVGRYTADQFGANRPVPELGAYRTPIKGLYLCGSSSHPGGAVTGGPGYICADKISADLGVPKWWKPIDAPVWEEYYAQAL
jgi:phytoene dehydrogenase-like protein